MAQTRRRRTAEEIRMLRAEHDRDIEEVIAERDQALQLLDKQNEQHREALGEIDKLYRDQVTDLRAQLAHANGEREALRHYIAIVQTDHSVASHFAAGAKIGLEHIERLAEQLHAAVRDIHTKAQQAANNAHEEGEQKQLAAPIGAPGTRPSDDEKPAPKFLSKPKETDQ